MSYNKWNSRRWQVCVWAIFMTSIIILWLMILPPKDTPTWVVTVLNLFQLIIGGYIAADSFTKPKGEPK